MDVNREMFVTGLPIDTKFGKIRFITYMEYFNLAADLAKIPLTPLHLFYMYAEQLKSVLPPPKYKEVLEELRSMKNIGVYEYAISNEDFLGSYLTIFDTVIEDTEDKIDKIEQIIQSEEDFLSLRTLIMEMNLLIEEKVTENEEIQMFWNMSKKAKSNNSEKFTPIDMVTSIVANTSETYESVLEMTVLQVKALYSRIVAKNDYLASIIWATIPSEKPPKLESWARHIDLHKNDDSNTMTMDEFNKQIGGLFE